MSVSATARQCGVLCCGCIATRRFELYLTYLAVGVRVNDQQAADPLHDCHIPAERATVTSGTNPGLRRIVSNDIQNR